MTGRIIAPKAPEMKPLPDIDDIWVLHYWSEESQKWLISNDSYDLEALKETYKGIIKSCPHRIVYIPGTAAAEKQAEAQEKVSKALRAVVELDYDPNLIQMAKEALAALKGGDDD